MLYDLGSRIIKLTFDTIEAVDTSIGVAAVGPALLLGASKLIRSVPDVAQDFLNIASSALKRFIQLRRPTVFFNASKFTFMGSGVQLQKFLDAAGSLQSRYLAEGYNWKEIDRLKLNDEGKQVYGGFSPWLSKDQQISLYREWDNFTLIEALGVSSELSPTKQYDPG